MAIQLWHGNRYLRNLQDITTLRKKLIKQQNESRMKKNEDPEVWITNLECLGQRIAECGKTMDDNELIMHVLYHLPTEYNNINDQYLKDLDDAKEIKLEDLCTDL
jgi:gag-polypeptide of LTR copia-type